jgi:hypothetical protein
MNGIPLLTMNGQRLLAGGADAVVLPAAAVVGLLPGRSNQALRFQAVQYRVEHPLAPLHVTARCLSNTPDDRVPVVLALGKHGKYHRPGRRGCQILRYQLNPPW